MSARARPLRRSPPTSAFLIAVLLVAACVRQPAATGGAPPLPPAPARDTARADTTTARGAPAFALVPWPAELVRDSGAFWIDSTTTIVAADADLERTAELLAAQLRPATGFPLRVVRAREASRAIVLRLQRTGAEEGYRLVATPESLLIAGTPAGVFRGTQTLRQLLPAAVESDMRVRRAWSVPALRIADQPRFAWRGAMLDVARHFMTVREVKQFIDLIALYRMNVLHLHLADDQGWRIEIRSRPRLTQLGATTQVGGGTGGFYTQNEYAELVRYAQDRHITIVPEIDMPGHTNAALVAYPELSCSRRPPAPYTGVQVGWSAFCPDNEQTYALVDDVVRELAALTPGPYIHLGGDEVEVLTAPQYAGFIERVQDIVARHGKSLVGWEEIAQARLRPTTLVQHWRRDTVAIRALDYGARLILSPSPRTYLDMKYTRQTELGLAWAGVIEVADAYNWDPGTYLARAAERDIAGIEAPIWTETLRNITAVQYLAVPRLPALAEVAWTPQAARGWEDFRVRLAAHAPRWNYLGVNWYRSPQVPWPTR